MSCFLSTHKTLLSVALSASLLAGMTSCQDEDFGYAKDQIAYETNFKKAFGEIPADKSWDLSSAANWVDPLMADHAASETRATRAGALPYHPMADYSWVVPNGIFSWMQSRLIEGNDNRYLGSSFILKVPDSDFAIIPIFQGNSAITSELEVKVNGFDLTKVWTKSEGMKATDTNNDEDADPLGYYEGWSKYDQYYDETPNHPASTIKAKKVWTKPIVFHKSDLGAGNFMYLSLHNIAKIYNSNGTVWDSSNTWTTVGDRLTSINPDGQMLALDVDGSIKEGLRSQLPNIVDGKTPSEMMIIGCEDANGSSSDHDNNDIVFLIVGYPSVPTVIPLTETIEKRYMCEDLGGTHDFDFNDIVVDVKQVSTYKLVTTPVVSDWNFNGSTNNSVEITEIDKVNSTRKQTAKIAHVCGTLPIQAQVGNYLFPWISDPTNQPQTRTELLAGGWTFNGSSWVVDNSSNDKTRGTQPKDGWNPNEEKTVTGWDPNQNNIKVYVQWPKNWKSEPGHDVGVSSPTNGPGNSSDYIYKVSNPYLNADMQAILQDFRDFDFDRLKAVAFPDNGRVPYIIAVDPSVKWMQEDECIDMAWLRQADHTKNHANESGVGSGGYYENPNAAAPEVVVWQGSFTGEKWNHGLDFPVGSAQYNGIIDAFDGYAQCNTLNIYFDKDYTDRKNDGKVLDKTISLATHGSSGWERLTDTEADNYVAPRDVTPVTIDGKQCYQLQIKLTDEQISAIRNGGLVVQLSSDNVMLHKISFTKESGFEINLTTPEHGKIETASRKRERYGDAADSGRVPFTHAAYVSGSSVTLTAVGDDGYDFDTWLDGNGNAISGSNPLTVNSNTSLGVRFKQSINPELRLADAYSSYNKIILTKGMSLSFNVDSKNQFTKVDSRSSNSSVAAVESGYSATVSINAVEVGSATITLSQAAATDGEGRYYQASEDLTVEVTVLPAVGVDLAVSMFHKWTSGDVGAIIEQLSNVGGSLSENTSTGLVYGHGSVLYNHFADLTTADALVATVTEGEPRFLFNREVDNGSIGVELPRDAATYETIINNADGSKTVIVNLKAIREKYGYVHLHAIKGAADANTTVTSLKLDNYFCAGESAKPRTIWTGNAEGPASGWGQANITIPASSFTTADTYRNTKMRIYLEKQNTSDSNFGICPIAGGWGGKTPIYINGNLYGVPSTGYYDIDMDKEFFETLQSSQKLTLNGVNYRATKIELVANSDAVYNLMLDKPTYYWNYNFETSPIVATSKVDSDQNGFGWKISESSVVGSYNTVVFELADVSYEGTSEDKSYQLWITAHGSTYSGKDKTVVSGNTLKLNYSALGDNSIYELYVCSNKQVKFRVVRAYLAVE